MSHDDFIRMSSYVSETFGIKLPEAKKLMLEGRLRRRLIQLQMPSFKEYCEYLFSPEGQLNEVQPMIDLVSTNKTDFFREADHFNYLANKVLPEFVSTGNSGRTLSVWSAGCSTGEECYTLAMILSEFFSEHRSFDFTILATDISMRVLQAAHLAIYPDSKIAPIPLDLRRKYLLRGKGAEASRVRFVPEIRRKVKFERLNLLELGEISQRSFQIIFCRNVIIYFDRPTQERLIGGFYERLKPGGYLFLGHSEALPGLKIPLQTVAPMIYRKV
ncbi:MAG: chemotaxis protein CheR [Candidatus Riflebacteria bacterium GWC2_50_8]|nr:MAG: chemotaxis protein CheR [Candidatus Riflebacteria bacterium GWC2_50_8]